MEYYSAIKKEQNNATCCNMDGPRNYHTKCSESERDKYHMLPLICGILKKQYKKKKNHLISDVETESHRKQTGLRGGKAKTVQSLNHVHLFMTPWTAAHQASLSITVSQGLLRLMSPESVMPPSHLILRRPLLLPPSIFPTEEINGKGAVDIQA